MLARLEEFTPRRWAMPSPSSPSRPRRPRTTSPPTPSTPCFPRRLGHPARCRYLRPRLRRASSSTSAISSTTTAQPPCRRADRPVLPKRDRPRGLLRVREFTQAEISTSCTPSRRTTALREVADVMLSLFSRDAARRVKKPFPMTIGEAVEKGIVANQTLGYFTARTQTVLEKIGQPERLRFRQHLQHEMAHYAEDCWDAEIECSYGWIGRRPRGSLRI